MRRHLTRHWPLAILIVLQCATISLHFVRIEHEERVEMRVEAFENLIRMSLDRAFNIGRSTCSQKDHMY